MTKYLLIMYMCSMLSGQCPSSHVTGYSFDTHAACVEYGYRVAHGTFKSLEEVEEFTNEYIENSKIVVKFECKEVVIPNKNSPKKPFNGEKKGRNLTEQINIINQQ